MGQEVSVIMPAFNGERYLLRTLEHLRRARGHLGEGRGEVVGVIVSDDSVTDRTAEIAIAAGAWVVSVLEHDIGRIRKAGASAASCDLLVSLDADTLAPECLPGRIPQVMEEPACLGGAADTDHRPALHLIRANPRTWRPIGLCFGMAQGALQSCGREVFLAPGGDNERSYMGEDAGFHWRLRRLAKSRGQHLCHFRDVRVVPSCRRFDQRSTARILIETSPLYITRFRGRHAAWRGWYGDVPR